jgi:hypothetical protein
VRHHLFDGVCQGFTIGRLKKNLRKKKKQASKYPDVSLSPSVISC